MGVSRKKIFLTIFSVLKNRKNFLFWMTFIILHFFMLNNLILLSRDMLTGDFSATNLKPLPRLNFARVSESPIAEKYKGVNRLAADFSQIYFPSQNFSSLAKNYKHGTFDPWQRQSRYAPILHAICAKTFCKHSYGYASLIHMAIQLFLFYISFLWAFKILQLEKYIPYGVLLVNICMFLTPVGLTWFERGQFSLYVSLSYLWLALGIYKRNILFIIFSALFAYIKLTSFPLIFVILIVLIMSSQSLTELKKNVLFAFVFSLTIALLFLSYLDLGILFIQGALEQEALANPLGISLGLLLPKVFVKILPLALIFLGYFHIRKYKNDFVLLVPYLTGCGVILVTYPTLAYDYSVPTLFCFIPLIIFWSKRSLINVHPYMGIHKYLFPLFLVTASFSNKINSIFHSEETIIFFYILFSIVLIFSPLFSLYKNQEIGVVS